MTRRKKPLKIIAGAPDKPLRIGGLEIECYVLENTERVLSQKGFLTALGRAGTVKGGHGARGGDEIPYFLAARNLKPFISKKLLGATNPIAFAPPTGGIAYGYKAVLLPEVCSVYLEARLAGALHYSQLHIAEQAEVLLKGFATVGIIGLIDEATGYEKVRERRALATILEKFIADELQPWTKTFPYEFYEQIFRLKKWPGPEHVKRPQVIGHYTNNFVYKRLAPGVLEELRNKAPKDTTGHRRSRFHQWFTPEFGHPELQKHIHAVIAIMKVSPNWTRFVANINRAFPEFGHPIPMAIFDKDEEDGPNH